MSTKKINAGDTLTVGDLTDDYLGAEIEVGVPEGTRYRMVLRRIYDHDSILRVLVPERDSEKTASPRSRPVTVIDPPPAAPPEEPKVLGQCVRIEGDDGWRAVVVESRGATYPIRDTNGDWWCWGTILSRAAGRRVIVSDPPRWPDETPVVPGRIEVGEWPDNDDTHLREWVWIDSDSTKVNDGDPWWWHEADGKFPAGWSWGLRGQRLDKPDYGPWTRGERVE